VVLKTLGATRGLLLTAYLCEYAFIGAATAVFGVVAGAAAADLVVTDIMHLDFVWLWPQALVAALGALVVTIFLGLVGTWRILGRKPAAYLRNL
jgi:putative ABC transport system permease protein